MEYLADYYEDLGVSRTANQQEIEHAYHARISQLGASKTADAREELHEVQTAYSVLHSPVARKAYDQRLREKEEREDKKYAELDAQLKRRHHHRKTIRGSSGLLDAAWALLSFIFKFK
jgi:DnaJ-class molecular chaperone